MRIPFTLADEKPRYCNGSIPLRQTCCIFIVQSQWKRHKSNRFNLADTASLRYLLSQGEGGVSQEPRHLLLRRIGGGGGVEESRVFKIDLGILVLDLFFLYRINLGLLFIVSCWVTFVHWWALSPTIIHITRTVWSSILD